VRWNLIVILICSSFMAKDGEHFFMCFMVIWVSSFEKVLFSLIAHFFIGSLILGEFSFFELLVYSGYQSFVWCINSKWIKDHHIRPETLKLLQKRAENTLKAIGIGKDFLSRTPETQQLRESMDKWNYMKLKSFSTKKKCSLNWRDHSQSGRKYFLAIHQTRYLL
jgi:hypothetical protein